jgi:putative transcriptional regulator
MDSLRAHLLVASPKLPDPNFYRSVVLMIQHTDEGALGVVLNRPTNVTIGDVWEQIADESCDNREPINLGGPVEGPLLALHQQKSCSEGEVLPGVFLATQKDHLRKIISRSERPYRLFSGYAGWGGGQLEGELKMGGWLTTPAKVEHVFAASDDLWKSVADEIGRQILGPVARTKHVPNDPTVN